MSLSGATPGQLFSRSGFPVHLVHPVTSPSPSPSPVRMSHPMFWMYCQSTTRRAFDPSRASLAPKPCTAPITLRPFITQAYLGSRGWISAPSLRTKSRAIDARWSCRRFLLRYHKPFYPGKHQEIKFKLTNLLALHLLHSSCLSIFISIWPDCPRRIPHTSCRHCRAPAREPSSCEPSQLQKVATRLLPSPTYFHSLYYSV
jgi:hypothetical protein